MTLLLAEHELDAANQAREDAALHAQRERWYAVWPSCCGGCNSNQGRLACTCGGAALDEAEDMWGPERTNPWLLALYAAALVLSIAASTLWPLGVAP
jgi:hypothetical protein